MKLLNIEHKDVHFQIDMSLEELIHIKNLFDCATIKFDSEKEPEMIEADAFLREKFYPFLKDVVKMPKEE